MWSIHARSQRSVTVSGETLSLPARLHLLSYDPVRMRPAATGHQAHLVTAAALAELARRGMLRDEGGTARAVPGDRTGDPVLDGLSAVIGADRPRRWKSWVTHRPAGVLDAVRAQLADAGVLRTRQGLFGRTRYELARADTAATVRERARAVLTGAVPVAEVSDEDAALVALATAAELRAFATGRERRAYRARIAELTERAGSAAPALRKVMEEARAAITAAVTASAAAGVMSSGG
ncbi:GPP34 family phosphoprotein [Streptomyces jumonjinensis]|uniref:GPP34 family phosphoprotein n=1 Tax=Streptomyces jumonjinensis TaxID=1945 RepID=A0A646KIG0_STRJU|nr:GPP34 family phosphoprotein [Streptomyces jumonjinensis]